MAPTSPSPPDNPTNFFAFTLGPFFFIYVFGSAAYVVTRGRFRKKWESTELLLERKLFARPVAQPIALGALWGVTLAAIPYVIAAVWRGSGLAFGSASVLAAPIAASDLLHPAAILPALGFLGFAWPLAAQMRNKFVRVSTLAFIVIGFCLGPAGPFDSVAAGLMAGALSAVLCVILYVRVDLLAAACALLSARAILAPSILFAQPLAGFRETGLYLLAIFGAGLAVFSYYAVRGRENLLDEDAERLLDSGQDDAALRGRRAASASKPSSRLRGKRRRTLFRPPLPHSNDSPSRAPASPLSR